MVADLRGLNQRVLMNPFTILPMKTLRFIPLFLLFSVLAFAQQKDRGNVYVDQQGVMRWEKTKTEVQGFGVNYSVPFAHAYRTAKRMGVDIKKAIDNDIYHFTRLGFDLYRLHVWDTEISDEKGNLIDNEHLEAFDYLLAQLKKHQINYVITPIAFWGNGWPEPDTKTSGFSSKYGKGPSLYNPEAIAAQQRYLFQFLNHVNRYTGVAYKDEPNVIAFEVSNEPHHRGDPKKVTEFVKGMVKSMKKTGTKKPIFYNISHGVHFAENYFKGGIDGGTFQWYPTGLGYQRELPGNALPNVNDYSIPFNNIIQKNKGAKLVYEFDAADIGRSYMYPAIARSFRTAGIQIATHFAYDPTYMAYANTEYNTHYMNLVYTPQKALSLKIAGMVFHEVPMYTSFGTYPQNTSFGNTRVSYTKDLALYSSPTALYYTNTTETSPKNEAKLIEIAGFGNSPIVHYKGSGAYFLDKLENGVWRLEVLPDALWVDNPFGRNSPEKTVGVIQWNTHQMQLKLQDLGTDFSIRGLNEGNTYTSKTSDGSFEIKPGTYLVYQKGKTPQYTASDRFKSVRLGDYFAPKTTVSKPWMLHQSPKQVSTGAPLILEAQYIAPNPVASIKAVGFLGTKRFAIDLQKDAHFNYSGRVPDSILSPGYLNYHLIVKTTTDEYHTYPAGKKGQPWDWDFYDRTPYKVAVTSPETPVYLFDAKTESQLLVRGWRRGMQLVPTQNHEEATYDMPVGKLFYKDNENLNARPIFDYSFKHFIIDKINHRSHELSSKKKLVFYGKALEKNTTKIQVAFVMSNGAAFGGMIDLHQELEGYTLDLNNLKPVQTVTLPRPYPSFLPYYFKHNNTAPFSILDVESIQISIGPGLSETQKKLSHGISISKMWLE